MAFAMGLEPWRHHGSLQEAYIHGVSTRAVDDLVRAMGLTGASKSQVSRLCEEIDERVQAFLNRPLVSDWPFLWLDATYVKLRKGGRIVSMAVIVAVAVNSDGRREILGITVMPSEAETFWAGFLRSLTRRGLRGVQMVISDAHEGLKAAAGKVLGAGWQRCRVHFQRNLLARVGKTNKPVVSAVVKTVFAETDRDQAHARWREVADSLRDRFRDVAELMDGEGVKRSLRGERSQPERARRPRLHGLRREPAREAAQHQPARAHQQDGIPRRALARGRPRFRRGTSAVGPSRLLEAHML